MEQSMLDLIKQAIGQLNETDRAALAQEMKGAPADLAQALAQRTTGSKDPRIATIEARIGKVTQKGGKSVPFEMKIEANEWPKADPFGRPYVTLDHVAGLTRSEMFAFVTNTGYPKVKIMETTFFIRPEAGETGYGQPIGAGEWRFHNGMFGKLAQVHKANELKRFLRRGMDSDVLEAAWKAAGLPNVSEYVAGQAHVTPQIVQPAMSGTVALPKATTRRRRSQKDTQHTQDSPAA